jgi:hypothetical protein
MRKPFEGFACCVKLTGFHCVTYQCRAFASEIASASFCRSLFGL